LVNITPASKQIKIFIAGSEGMVGSALVRQLREAGYRNLLCTSRSDLDLTEQVQTVDFFDRERPDVVVLAAAKVGGILANSGSRADFIYQNLMIESNVIHSAFRTNVKKLICLGSSCIYPRMATQPIKEEYLLLGPLEPTNEPYAIAKIAGIKLCESYYQQYHCNFFSVMPTNLYGPNDNFNPETSHVIPALIGKLHAATHNGEDVVRLWGTGTPRREFLYVDDLGEAIVFLMENCDAIDFYENGVSHINIGTGVDIEIRRLALMISEMIGFTGRIEFDSSMPDGTHRKLLDVSRIHALGWRHSMPLAEGLRKTYDWFLNTLDSRSLDFK